MRLADSRRETAQGCRDQGCFNDAGDGSDGHQGVFKGVTDPGRSAGYLPGRNIYISASFCIHKPLECVYTLERSFDFKTCCCLIRLSVGKCLVLYLVRSMCPSVNSVTACSSGVGKPAWRAQTIHSCSWHRRRS